MKIKKFLSTMIFLAITIIAYIAATLLFCYTTKPEVSKGTFPFSITYEYKGETNTLSGVLECEYSGSSTIQGEHRRYWEQEIVYDDPNDTGAPYMIEQNDELQTTLAIQAHMQAGYFMGDPLYADCYAAYGLEGPEPYVEYFDYINDISLDEENEDEILESLGLKIIEHTYAEPIENSFSFSGVRYKADNVIIFIAISLVFFLLCVIFVRRDKGYQYSKLDKIGIVCNVLVGLFAVPFISFVCVMFGIVESHVGAIDQITYNIPPIAIVCLALSVVFRRKGLSQTGFFIQFAGIPLFTIILVLDALF